ncbi:MAG: cytochrome c biogenesis protein/redoxin [Raoultibacter sp.]
MDISLGAGISALTVFVQGLLSFFSPCVLPLVPLYIGYLAGGAKQELPDGTMGYPRKKVLINTLFFVIGIGFAFMVLGLGFSALGQFFTGNRFWFSLAAGVIMLLFGLYMLGVFGRRRGIEAEHRLPFKLDRWAMNPLVALALGFTFSFAWTPCIGPVLTSVLLMASSSASALSGFVLIGVYTLGFVLPFLAVGLFTGEVLNFFKKHTNVVAYTVKIGGALLIVMGIMTMTGLMGGVSSSVAALGASDSPPAQKADEAAQPGTAPQPGETAQPDKASKKQAVPDFTLSDQYGTTYTLADLRGKTVFLNFFATWCGPCQREMPDIQALYERYGKNSGDVIVLGVANPKTPDNPKGADVGTSAVASFLENKGYTYPALMDETGAVFQSYGVSSFPKTFIIDKQGNLSQLLPGLVSAEKMQAAIEKSQATA